MLILPVLLQNGGGYSNKNALARSMPFNASAVTVNKTKKEVKRRREKITLYLFAGQSIIDLCNSALHKDN